MKLIQTPSLITGAILGASLITLSAASNDSALGGLNVFFPGTAVSSTEVNDNFTYLDDGMTTLEGRVDNLEGSSSSTQTLIFENSNVSDTPSDNSNLTITVPQGYGYRIIGGHVFRWPGALNSIGATDNIYIKVDNMIFAGADPDVSNTAREYMEKRPYDGELYAPAVVFPPGASLTFYKFGTSSSVSDLQVIIEAIPYNLQNQQ